MKTFLLSFVVSCALPACGSPKAESQNVNAKTVKLEPAVAESQVSATTSVPTEVGLPSFDTSAYCQTIGAAAGGSYQSEETCQVEERKAHSKLLRSDKKIQLIKYCREIGDAMGGSYQIMLTCVEDEIAASRRS